jgi:hypothetical protein
MGGKPRFFLTGRDPFTKVAEGNYINPTPNLHPLPLLIFLYSLIEVNWKTDHLNGLPWPFLISPFEPGLLPSSQPQVVGPIGRDEENSP